jgi:bifunctional ADP-heptose synthase (sugar kinase/adenylyltransferase)
LALASGFGHADAANIANHSGGLVVMKKGTAVVTRDELVSSIRRDQVTGRSNIAG